MLESSGGGLRRCADCGTEIAPLLLSCPACGPLVHGGELRRLAAEAAASEAGDPRAALGGIESP